MTQIPVIAGISEVSDKYDGFILDLWGVIHDGEKPYPGVPECLKQLKAGGKQVCLLSNAPRRTDSVVEKLENMGVSRDLYAHIMTSGEATWRALKSRDDAWYAKLGDKCYHLGPERDFSVLEGQDFSIVDTPAEADFVVNTGIYDFGDTMEDYEDTLQACHAAKLPMVCANPDLIVVTARHGLALCAGSLAQRYEELGGEVSYHGKPHKGVYEACFELLAGIAPERILAVGDSLHTDIAGATNAGIDSVLVAGGIHREELFPANDSSLDSQALARLSSGYGYRPTGTLGQFLW